MTKEQLSEYRSIRRETEQLRQVMQQLRQEAENLRAASLTGEAGKTGVRTDTVGAAVVRYLDASQTYANKLGALLARQAEIEYAIETLPQTERELMRYRYIQGLYWEDISQRMHYSMRQAQRLHAAALRRLEEV